MTKRKPALRIALLAVAETTGSTLYGMYDLFSSVGRDWRFLMEGVPGEQPITPEVVARTDEAFVVAYGVWVKPDYRLTQATRPDVLCIPELFIASGADLKGRYTEGIEWVGACYRSGTVLATACSGALRLEEAKQILETTEKSIDAVANEVGYAEASFFSRLFRRKVGITPAQYRKRFGGLRKALMEKGISRADTPL